MMNEGGWSNRTAIRDLPSILLNNLPDCLQWQEHFQGCIFQTDKAIAVVINFGSIILGINKQANDSCILGNYHGALPRYLPEILI